MLCKIGGPQHPYKLLTKYGMSTRLLSAATHAIIRMLEGFINMDKCGTSLTGNRSVLKV